MSETPTEPTPPERARTEPEARARIEPEAPPKRLDALPVLYLVGFAILASALIYMWRHPSMPRSAVQDSQRVATLQQESAIRRQEMEAMAARIAAVEARPAPSAAPLEARIAALETRPGVDTKPLEARIAALEGRPGVDLGPLEARLAAAEAKPPVDLRPLESRIAALDAKPPVDLKPLDGRVAVLEAKPPVDLAPLEGRVAAVEARRPPDLAPLERSQSATAAKLEQVAAGLAAITDRARLVGRLQAASVALEAGQRLGALPGAPPALARFANDAPPTEAQLRLSFTQAAEAAQRASSPATTADKPLLDRMWARAQQSVTVRQGDRVLVGDPIAGVIGHARQLLEAGDLAGAVKVLEALPAGPKAAMADWIGRARSLLDARAAIAELAARG